MALTTALAVYVFDLNLIIKNSLCIIRQIFNFFKKYQECSINL